MATIRAVFTLSPGTHRIRVRVSSPYGHVELQPVVVAYGAESVEGEHTATALDGYALLIRPAWVSFEETLTTVPMQLGNALKTNVGFREQTRAYDIVRPSGLTVADILGTSGFTPWWHRWKQGGSLWARRPPGR